MNDYDNVVRLSSEKQASEKKLQKIKRKKKQTLFRAWFQEKGQTILDKKIKSAAAQGCTFVDVKIDGAVQFFGLWYCFQHMDVLCLRDTDIAQQLEDVLVAQNTRYRITHETVQYIDPAHSKEHFRISWKTSKKPRK